MHQFAALALLICTRCAVLATPLHARGVNHVLDPWKSVPSDLFGTAKVHGGFFPAAKAPTVSQTTPITPSSQSPTVSNTDAAQSSATATVTFGDSSAADASKTTEPSSTGSVSNIATSINPLAITAGASGSQTSPSGSSTADPVSPTTTGGSGSCSSRPGSGPASPSGSGSGSGGSSAGSSSSESRKSNSLSPSQTAAAVILPVLALVGATLALIRFCPPVRRRYEDWRHQRLESRAYRRALDDPVMSFGGREKALGHGGAGRLMRPLSFGFSTPQHQDIRRMPLEWDAARIGSDRVSAIGMAVPLGRHWRTVSDISESDRPPSPYEDARSDQT